MVSRKKHVATRLLLTFFIIFGNSKSNALIDIHDNKVRVTDFKYFRKITYKNQQLLVYKNTGVKSFFYLSNKIQFNYTSQNSKLTTNFESQSKNKNHKIQYIDNKIKYYSKNKTIYYDSTSLSPLCEQNTFNNLLKSFDQKVLRPLQTSIANFNFESLADESCTSEQKEKVSQYLADTLNTESGSLAKCLENKTVENLMNDADYRIYIGNMYAKYLQLAQQIADGKTPLKISCKMNETNKLGSYNENSAPPKISLNFDVLSKQVVEDNQLNEIAQKTLGHELFHLGQSTVATDNEKYSECINEEYAKLFNDLCKFNMDADQITSNSIYAKSSEIIANQKRVIQNQKIPVSVEINALCCKKFTCANEKSTNIDSQNEFVSLDANVTTTTGKGTGGATLNSQVSQAQLVAQQNTAVQNNLSQNLTRNDFEPVSGSTIARLATDAFAPNVQIGKETIVPAGSSYEQDATQAFNSISRTTNNRILTTLNNAIAATQNTAQANTLTATNATQPRLPASTNNSQTSTSSISNSNPNIAANLEKMGATTTGSAIAGGGGDSGNRTTSNKNVSDNQTYSSVAGGGGVTSGGSASESGTGAINDNLNNTSGANTTGGSTTAGGSTVATNNSNATTDNTQTNTQTNSKNSRMPAAINNSLTNANNPAAFKDTIDRLKAFTAITPNSPTYTELKKNYSNRNFIDALIANGITITYTENGVKKTIPTNLPNNNNRVTRDFVDSGNGLQYVPKK